MIIVQGKIVDATSGEPLAGASVTLKDYPSIGTSADSEGKFSLGDADLDDPFAVVQISHVDYNPIEYTVDEMPARVLMAKTGNVLAEAIVSAHKVTRKKGFWPFAIVTIIVVILLFKYKQILKWSAPIACMLFVFCSCSSVNKVNKDQSKQLKVIANYTKSHPFKNDTVYNLIKGDTVTVSDTVTSIVEQPGQTQYKDKVVIKTITLTKTIRDTIETTITDKSMEASLRQIISEKDVDVNTRDMEIQKQKTEIETYRLKSQRWFTWFCVLLGLDTLYVFLKIKRII